MNLNASKRTLREPWETNLVLGHLGRKSPDTISILSKEIREKYDIYFINYKNSMLGVGGVGTVTRALLKVLPELNMVCYDPSYESKDSKHVFTVPLDPKVAKLFHGEYAKLYLWPVLHNTASSLSERRVKDLRSSFSSSSRAFAEETIRASKGKQNPIYWVNDYNLAGTVGYLRQMSPKSKIIFSLRTPFGVSDFPTFYDEDATLLLESLLKADIISFHREKDVTYFLKFVNRYYKNDPRVKINWENHTIEVDNHIVIPRAFVMGNDPDYRQALSMSRESRVIMEEFKGMTQGKVITSVSRFDRTKGVDFELDCIESLLRNYPQVREKFTFLRVSYLSDQKKSTPSYKKSYDNVIERIRKINKTYGNDKWKPIVRKFEKKLCDVEMTGLFRATDILLVGSLGDGFNHILVEAALSKEEQDTPMSIVTTDIGATDYLEGYNSIDRNDITKSAEVLYNVLNEDSEDTLAKYEELRKGASRLYAYNWALSIFQASIDISEVPIINKVR